MRKEVLVLVFFVLLGPLFAQVYKAPCIRDAYVSSGAQFQRVNWGFAPDLFIGISDAPNYQIFGNLTTYMLFDLPFIPNASEFNIQVKSANITVSPRSVSGNSSFAISFFTCTETTWNESSVTWTSRPSTERAISLISPANFNSSTPINVTNLIQTYVNGRRSKLCVGFGSIGSGTAILYSRQSSNSTRYPTLSVEFIQRPPIPTLGTVEPLLPLSTGIRVTEPPVTAETSQGRPTFVTTGIQTHHSTPKPIITPNPQPKQKDNSAIVISLTLIAILAAVGVIFVAVLLWNYMKKTRAPPVVELVTVPETSEA